MAHNDTSEEEHRDVEALFEILHGSRNAKTVTIRQPESIRMVFADANAFVEQRRSWQLMVLRKTAAALRTRYDVVRFLCLESLEEEEDDVNDFNRFCENQHDIVFDSLLRLFEMCEKKDETVADGVLLVLSCIISAGITVKNLKQLLKVAADAMVCKESRKQLRILHLIDSAVRRGSDYPPSQGRGVDITMALALDPSNRSPYLLDRDELPARKLLTCSPGPKHFFNLGGGPKSGIRLSGLGKWPFQREYCVWYWARFEEGCGRCNIVQLKTENGYGINISMIGDDIIGYSIMMESKDERNVGSVRVTIPPERMTSRSWHQVTIHHYSRMLGSSVVKVYVDGHEIKQPSGYGFVLMLPSRMSSQALTKATVFEGFDGQAGPFYLFTEGIAPSASTALLNSELRLFESELDACAACPGNGLAAGMAQNGLEQKVFIGFEPRSCVKNVCLDIYGGHHGLLRDNSTTWNLQTIKDLIGAVGGISSLLPFLWKKGRTTGDDKKMEATFTRVDSFSLSSSGESQELCEGACIIQIVNLLARLLDNHLANQREFRLIGGASLIASALERIPQKVLSSACSTRLFLNLDVDEDNEESLKPTSNYSDAPFFDALRNLFLSVSSWPEIVFDAAPTTKSNSPKSAGNSNSIPSASSSEPAPKSSYNTLERSVETSLLFNLKLVARCTSYNDNREAVESWTQLQWFEYLERRVVKHRAQLRSCFTIQEWFDNLRLFYDYLVYQEVTGVNQQFVDFFGYHAARVGVAFLVDSVSEEELQVLICASIGAGHGASSPSMSLPSPTSAKSTETLYSGLLAPHFRNDGDNPESAPPGTPRNNSIQWTLVELYLARDAVRMLTILMRLDTPPMGLFESCCRLDNGYGLASLLAVNVISCPRVGEGLRALSLRCITEYLQRVEKNVPNFDSITSTSRKPTLFSSGRIPRGVQVFANVGGYATLLHALSTLLTQRQREDLNSTYSALLEMMIAKPVSNVTKNSSRGRFHISDRVGSRRRSVGSAITNNTQPTLTTITSASEIVDLEVADLFTTDQSKLGPVLDDTQNIHNPHVLMIIVKLLPRMDLYLQQRVCQDLFLLLKFQPGNRRHFTEVAGWQGSFLGLLGSLDRNGLRSSGAQVCYDLGVKLLLLVLTDALCEKKDGWKELETLLSLHPLLVNGDSVVRSLLAQLFQEVHRHLQSEDVSSTFPILWHSLRRMVILVDMYSCLVQNVEEMHKIIETLLEIVDLVCSFPPRLLHEKFDGSAGHSPKSGSGEIDLLKEFCWPVEIAAQDELDKIRGPVGFSLTTLALRLMSSESPDSPSLPRHAKLLSKIMSFLRKMPPVKTMIRWSVGDGTAGTKIKGEKSALVAKTFLMGYQLINQARVGGGYEDNRVAHNLDYLLELLKSMSLEHSDLLTALTMSHDRFLLRKIQSLQGDNPEWVTQSCMTADLLPSDLSSSLVSGKRFQGFEGAMCALDEASVGIKVFLEAKLKENWENYCAQEMSTTNTKLRVRLETTAVEFQQRLSYVELSRLSAFTTTLHERDCELVLSWRKLTIESAHDASIWNDEDSTKNQVHWMMSDREDSMRCRRLLCRNYFFDPHEEAVYHYHKDNSTGSAGGVGQERSSLVGSTTSEPPKIDNNRHSASAGNNVEFLQKLQSQIRKNDMEESLYFFRSIGGRLKDDPDLTWFEYLGGIVRYHPFHSLENTTSRSRIVSSPPRSPHRRSASLRVKVPGSPQKFPGPERTKKSPQQLFPSSLLNEIDEWAVSGWENTRREQFALRKGESLVHVCSNAQWITPLQVTRGRVEISTEHIFFYAHKSYEDDDGDENVEPPEGESLRLETFVEEKWTDEAFVSRTPSKRSTPWRNKDMMRWTLVDLTEIHGRRYLLRSTALELFFKDMTNIFLCFPTAKSRKECFNAILKQNTPSLAKTFKESLKPKVVFERSDLMGRWQRREISNFEYLMQLNTIAGRSYNDITQYPVFPWVLCDYTSEKIDLNNPAVYRDLSKPIGALNQERLQDFVERFETFNDPSMDIPAFHYGSHYSNAGIVLHYLLRLEPYTTLAIDLQGGRFDCPDRLFFSIEDCWLGSMESMSDVKELIPEFFYCPEMLMNDNKLRLGTRQDNNLTVDDVILPPWANGSVHEFVRVNREALESEHVSRNLHHWIDLVFGYKQLGKEAEKAHNIFYYLTYEGAVDLDSIIDPVQRHSIETQIAHFGQTPSQLLTRPHPVRSPKPTDQVLRCLGSKEMLRATSHDVWSASTSGSVVDIGVAAAASPLVGLGSLIKNVLPMQQAQAAPAAPVVANEIASSHPPLVWMRCFSDRVICVHEDMGVAVHRLQGDLSALKVGQVRVLSAAPVNISVRARPRDKALLGSEIGQMMRIGGESIVCAKEGKLILSCNYLDNSLRAQNVDNYRIEDAVIAHKARVRCVSLCEHEDVVVTGSDDCTLGVWKLVGAQDIREEMMELLGAAVPASTEASGTGGNTSSSGNPKLLNIIRKLVGHVRPVTSCAVSSTMAVVISGSECGDVLVHALNDGEFLRMLLPEPLPGKITNIKVGDITGNIAISDSSGHLVTTTINGDLVSKRKIVEECNCMHIFYLDYHGSEVLVTGHVNGEIHVRSMNDLELIGKVNISPASTIPVPVRSIGLTTNGKGLLVGTEKGQLVIVKVTSSSM